MHNPSDGIDSAAYPRMMPQPEPELINIQAIARHLSSDDPVSVLLRGHLWIESVLTGLIRAELPHASEWSDLKRLPFASKVGLASAQGNLPWTEPLKCLNTLRNKIAHDPNFEIDPEQARLLLNAFPADFGTADEPEEFGYPPRTNPSADSPAQVVVACVEALLTYLLAILNSLLESNTRRMQEQTARLMAFQSSEQPAEPSRAVAAVRPPRAG